MEERRSGRWLTSLALAFEGKCVCKHWVVGHATCERAGKGGRGGVGGQIVGRGSGGATGGCGPRQRVRLLLHCLLHRLRCVAGSSTWPDWRPRSDPAKDCRAPPAQRTQLVISQPFRSTLKTGSPTTAHPVPQRCFSSTPSMPSGRHLLDITQKIRINRVWIFFLLRLGCTHLQFGGGPPPTSIYDIYPFLFLGHLVLRRDRKKRIGCIAFDMTKSCRAFSLTTSSDQGPQHMSCSHGHACVQPNDNTFLHLYICSSKID